jgi:hypothetical protein
VRLGFYKEYSIMPTSATYKTLRAVSATDDTGLAAGGAKWSDVSSIVVPIDYSAIGMAHIIFRIQNAANEIANWLLYLVKGVGSPAEFVAHGTATAGLTETGVSNEFYADQIAITKQSWYSTVKYIPGYQWNLGTGEVAGAGIGKLAFDTYEYGSAILLMSRNTCLAAGADIGHLH